MTVHQTPGPLSPLEELLALARRHHQAGRLAEAASAYARVLAMRPNAADVHTDFGNVLALQGQLVESQAHFERALAIKPDYARAHHYLGNLLWFQGRQAEAVARFARVVALMPGSAESHNNLASALLALDRLDDAARHFRRALALKPELAEAHNNLAGVLRQQGKMDEAIALCCQALRLKPAYAEAHNNLGSIFRQQGDHDEALAHFNQAIAIDPHYAEAHFDRAAMKTFGPNDPDLAQLEAIAADPRRLPPGKMAYVHFALGKALEDLGQHDRAFEQWLSGNALKRRQFRYDEAIVEQNFRLTRELFDATLLDRFAGSGDPSSLPIFIVGMPRSGTTLIEQILASHPAVHGGGELAALSEVASTVTDAEGQPVPYPHCLGRLQAYAWRQMGADYLARLPALPEGKTRISDKMPGNFIYVGLIRLILPNAKIIHIARDPVDTCVSCFSRLFATGQPFSYDLAELGRYYRRYSALMRHWQAVLPAGSILEVRYEDVVDDVRQQARRMLDFCGLPWDESCLSFHKTRRAILTASDVQVRKPIYRSSLKRWRRYEKYLGPLLAELNEDRN